jgi:hypothetical protein
VGGTPGRGAGGRGRGEGARGRGGGQIDRGQNGERGSGSPGAIVGEGGGGVRDRAKRRGGKDR